MEEVISNKYMGIILEGQQNHAANEVILWRNKRNKQVFEVSGPAGSGKTFIVYFIINKLRIPFENVIFMAYVGKATMALMRQGIKAQTIHSVIYDLIDIPRLDENNNFIRKNGRILTSPAFVKKDKLPDNIELLVVDEGSMVDGKIGSDILSFGIPVLVLGDLNQLPPIFGKPYFLNNPDVILTKIRRQKENDPIIHLSQQAINHKLLKVGRYGDKCFVINKEDITDNMLVDNDIVICGKNRTRDNINKYVRESINKINKPFPIIGDKIICRQNNWSLSVLDNISLVNGLVGYVKDIHLDTYSKKSVCIDFRPEFLTDEFFRRIPIDHNYLFKNYEERKQSKRSYVNKFEFAHAITAHLSQGSQYNNILVYDERMGNSEYYFKWLYTSITRAISGLIIAV